LSSHFIRKRAREREVRSEVRGDLVNAFSSPYN
jgi:hypothetical protein